MSRLLLGGGGSGRAGQVAWLDRLLVDRAGCWAAVFVDGSSSITSGPGQLTGIRLGPWCQVTADDGTGLCLHRLAESGVLAGLVAAIGCMERGSDIRGCGGGGRGILVWLRRWPGR